MSQTWLRSGLWALLLVLCIAPLATAYWEVWLQVNGVTYEYRKYFDNFQYYDSESYGIPNWKVGDEKNVRTIVYKSGALSDDWVVVQHISVLSNMQLTDTDTGDNGGAVLLFTSGGVGYQHFAATLLMNIFLVLIFLARRERTGGVV